MYRILSFGNKNREQDRLDRRFRGIPLGFLIVLAGIWAGCMHSALGDTIVVRWDPPTQNEDGSDLIDLAGHKVFYGTAPGSYTHVTNAGMEIETSLTGLDSNTTYYIAVKAYTTEGVESAFATEIVSSPLEQPPQTSSEYIWREVEHAELTEPMRRVPNALASGGQFVETVENYEGSAAITFSVTGGQYVVWARVAMTWPVPGTHDSVHVGMDDGSLPIWNFFVGEYDAIGDGTAWRWDAIYGNSSYDEPRVYDLTPGSHTLTLHGADALSKLDKVLITSDLTYNPETALSSCDWDGDGQPDDWAVAHFGIIGTPMAAPDIDADGDGPSNREEFVAGTDPLDPDSVACIDIDGAGSSARISFLAREAEGAGYAGLQRYYALEWCEDLATRNWSPVPQFGRILGAEQEVVVDDTMGLASCYYRARMWLE